MDFGNLLKTWREEVKNLNQASLAELSGISKIYISELERNKKIPTLDIIEKITKGLGVNLVEFFSLPSTNNSNTCNKIKDLVAQNKMTFKELAEELSISYSYIEEIAKGKLPDYATLVKIADYFKVHISYLADDNKDYLIENTKLLDFLVNVGNVKYLRLAMLIKEKNINPDVIENLITNIKAMQ